MTNFHAVEQLEPRRLLDAGDLDLSFDGGTNDPVTGPLVIDYPDRSEDARDMVVYPEGRILIAGESRSLVNPAESAVLLARFNVDGVPDSRFGVDGTLLTNARGIHTVQHVQLADDGMLYVMGQQWNDVGVTIATVLLRFNSRGRFDHSFGDNGRIRLPREFQDFIVDQQRRIIVVGGTSQSQATARRYLENGILDTTFAARGVLAQQPDVNADYRYTDVQIDSDGAIWLAGIAHRFVDSPPNDGDVFTSFASRLNDDGTLDSTFANSGNYESQTETGIGQILLSEGQPPVLVAGNNQFSTAFVNGQDDFKSNDDLLATAVVRQPDDKLLFAGSTPEAGVSTVEFQRLDPVSGEREASFGDAGVAIVDPNHESFEPALAISPDGSLAYAFSIVKPASNVNEHYMTIGKLWLDDRPTALGAARQHSPRSSEIVVSYGDDDGVNTTTLDNRDLRVTGPDGFVAYARFISKFPFVGGARVSARYKLAAPGGLWDSDDNGDYEVRLLGSAVQDVYGHRVEARPVTTFNIHK